MGGYRWFYLDALSDDGKSALVVIALLGSPFSPAYARARATGRTVDPLEFSAFNVCLTHRRCSRWALTERPARMVARDTGSLAIGTSTMRWHRDDLVIDVREQTSPWPSPLRGRIVFRPTAVGAATPLAIDGAGAHLWQPLAPLGRVEVELDDPGCSFRGAGYLDTNSGDEPLEAGFSSWSWTRVGDATAARVTYDVETRDGRSLRHGIAIDARGNGDFRAGVERRLRPTVFGLPRVVRVASGERAALLRTLEDGPFYARSAVEVARPEGATLRGVHETMSLDRLATRWVQRLIPFRSRRTS